MAQDMIMVILTHQDTLAMNMEIHTPVIMLLVLVIPPMVVQLGRTLLSHSIVYKYTLCEQRCNHSYNSSHFILGVAAPTL